jgi:hypothetical protein
MLYSYSRTLRSLQREAVAGRTRRVPVTRQPECRGSGRESPFGSQTCSSPPSSNTAPTPGPEKNSPCSTQPPSCRHPPRPRPLLPRQVLAGCGKKQTRRAALCGRGSVINCKYVSQYLSRARQQAVFGVFPHPARQSPVKPPARWETTRELFKVRYMVSTSYVSYVILQE